MADHSKVKVQVGQTWIETVSKIKHTLSRIQKLHDGRGHVYYKTPEGSEGGFGYITAEGYPEDWGVRWNWVYKVEVGMTLINPSSGTRYTISRVSVPEQGCFYRDATGKEQKFGAVDTQGYPNGWTDRWTLIFNGAATAPSTINGKLDLLDFFRSVRAGNCACNIPREQCKYHKE